MLRIGLVLGMTYLAFLAIWIWASRFIDLLFHHFEGWLFDWHVYLAAARNFVAGDLIL